MPPLPIFLSVLLFVFLIYEIYKYICQSSLDTKEVYFEIMAVSTTATASMVEEEKEEQWRYWKKKRKSGREWEE
jgi:hypothetical protein